MGMGIGINSQETDFGEIRGYQKAIACGVWFTSNGTVIPKMIKYQDGEGELHTVSNLHVLTCTKKNYCGIPTIEYLCSTSVGMNHYEFHLLFYIEKQEWKILWKNVREENQSCAEDTM